MKKVLLVLLCCFSKSYGSEPDHITIPYFMYNFEWQEKSDEIDHYLEVVAQKLPNFYDINVVSDIETTFAYSSHKELRKHYTHFLRQFKENKEWQLTRFTYVGNEKLLESRLLNFLREEKNGSRIEVALELYKKYNLFKSPRIGQLMKILSEHSENPNFAYYELEAALIIIPKYVFQKYNKYLGSFWEGVRSSRGPNMRRLNALANQKLGPYKPSISKIKDLACEELF